VAVVPPGAEEPVAVQPGSDLVFTHPGFWQVLRPGEDPQDVAVNVLDEREMRQAAAAPEAVEEEPELPAAKAAGRRGPSLTPWLLTASLVVLGGWWMVRR
jgi:hypothetical protein